MCLHLLSKTLQKRFWIQRKQAVCLSNISSTLVILFEKKSAPQLWLSVIQNLLHFEFLYFEHCFLCIWASAWDFQQFGMCDQQSLRPACAYAQSDQSLCLSLEYSMIVKLLTEHHLESLSLKGGCTGSSESTHVKMSNCWKCHALAHLQQHWDQCIRLRNDTTITILQENLLWQSRKWTNVQP